VAAVPDAELLRILRELGLKSSMVVPLVARGRALGAITFVWAESNRRYSEADLALAESLGRRAATAVDNARLYREVQEAIHTRDEFVASISHDLKNPLTALKAQAQILQRRAASIGGDEGEQMLKGLENVVVSASKINRLINDLLDLAHVQMGRPLDLNRQPFDLVELVRQMAAEQQQLSDDHAIRIKTAIPSLTGNWDRTRLERVFGNLLANSVKYSPDGGTVTLSVWQEDGDDGSFAVVAVEDQGLGIPERDLAHIFERFQRGSNVMDHIAGSGIGLAGAKQIVEQHGGTISVQSREGEGSTFTVRLPLD
jgi:signal transduction histidine kinase